MEVNMLLFVVLSTVVPQELRDHWANMTALAAECDLLEMYRDGHCHEAVMWSVLYQQICQSEGFV